MCVYATYCKNYLLRKFSSAKGPNNLLQFGPPSLMAEAMAVRSALINAREMGFSRICIKSDCQALVAIISSNQHPADLHGITRDIEHLSLSFDCISYVFISRNLNFVADALVKSALYSVSTN